jgi:two-component system response regulator CpxR
MQNYHLLMIDDDKELCDLLSPLLIKEHFKVTSFQDGHAGLQEALAHPYDIIVLDVMLPSMNGFEVLRELQARTETPVLMLTARGDEVDKVVGLEIGADDYLAKPCSPRELIARLRAILRRVEKSRAKVAEGSAQLKVSDLVLDFNLRTVTVAGNLLRLTVTEFDILACLCRDTNKVISKEVLYEKALGRPIELYDRSLDMHVSHLRAKLSHYPHAPEIKTVRGIGYLIES